MYVRLYQGVIYRSRRRRFYIFSPNLVITKNFELVYVWCPLDHLAHFLSIHLFISLVFIRHFRPIPIGHHHHHRIGTPFFAVSTSFSQEIMAHKSPRYCLYRDFVDAYMKGHPEMTRCVSLEKANLFKISFSFLF